LITCYDDNIASVKIIENNGGIFERFTEKEGKKLRRYWITL
jgi:predicted acetyltransferase